MANLRKEFSQIIKEQRKKKGWDQCDLAAEIGWSVDKVRSIEQSVTSAGLDEIEDLATVFRCEPADLMPKPKTTKPAPAENFLHVLQSLMTLEEQDFVKIVNAMKMLIEHSSRSQSKV